MYTGINGCLWVRIGAMGPRGHGETQKQGKQTQKRWCRHDLGPMAGEISPNIMFCQTKAKWAQTAPDGCAGVRMGAIGCIFTGKQENKEKWGKTSDQGIFCTCGHGQENNT